MAFGSKVAVVLAVAAVLAGCGTDAPAEKSESDRYQDRCKQQGGLVSIENGWQNTYKCVGQTTGAPLPELKG